ncbi:hypothetical protein F5Y14DRAFT_457695 [Nemania sp. NC0429]|nr:hypothetical protein F5Y14DRAFT_457695 [Nemania sp. NC0429]
MSSNQRLGEKSYAYDGQSDDDFDEEDIPLHEHELVGMPPTRAVKRRKILRTVRVFKDIVSLALSLFAIAVVYRLLQASPDTSAKPKSCNCGNSIAEARAMGCEYDEMAAAWLPAHCIDRELLGKFRESGDGPDGRWQYWSDSKHTHNLTIDEVGALADTPGSLFFTTFKWHSSHCFFYLWKIQRSRSSGVTIEARYDNTRHTKHCGEMFESNGEPMHPTYSYVTLDSDSEEAPEFVKDLKVEDN